MVGGGVVRAGCALNAAARGLGGYGVLIEDLLAGIRRRAEVGEVLAGTDDDLRVEVRYAAAAEGALHLDDVLARRTRLSIQTVEPDDDAADRLRRSVPDPYAALAT